MMTINAFNQSRQVLTEAALTASLRNEPQRQGRFTAFMLPSEGWPALMIYFNGELAWLQYFPAEDDPNTSLSQGNPDAEGMIVFMLEDGQLQEMPATCAVKREEAEQAATEFFRTGQLPTCIRWLEL